MDKEISSSSVICFDQQPSAVGAGHHHNVRFFMNNNISSSCDQGTTAAATVILNSLDDQVIMRSGRDHHVLNEMDFFGNKNDFSTNSDHAETTLKSGIVKKESTLTPDDGVEHILDMGLNLHTTSVTGINGNSTADYDHDAQQLKPDKPSNKEFAVLKSEIEKVNTENRRLKVILGQVSDKYRALQTQYGQVLHYQQNPNVAGNPSGHHHHNNLMSIDGTPEVQRKNPLLLPREFMGLGQLDIIGQKDQCPRSRSDSGGGQNRNESVSPPRYPVEDDFVAGHQLKNKKNNNKDDHDRNSGAYDDQWSPNKKPKIHSPKNNNLDQATEATIRKARVSVRARSQASMISDGCQWRKYGQKMAKGNPCPRAYYRCTMGVGCPVRKQVQRCAEDRSVLITTYEGHHNHPLPPAAMTMVSTTSSAASMLLSGSMPSSDGQLINPNNILARTLLPTTVNGGASTSLAATISASAPFPTITLDLTNTNNNTTSTNTTCNDVLDQLQKPLAQQFLPIPFLNQSHQTTSSMFSGLQNSHHQEMMNAARTAITSDPTFTAALVAAISSIMGGNGAQRPISTTSENKDNNNTLENSRESNLGNSRSFF